MNSKRLVTYCVLLISAIAISVIAEDSPEFLNRITAETPNWPCWRGPYRNGTVYTNLEVPTKWDAKTNVKWASPIPGRGHSSPIVVGDKVYITSADVAANVQWLLCFERSAGKLQWRKTVHEGGVFQGGNKKASQASSTVAFDGTRLIANFLNKNAIYTTAFSLTGEQLWQRKITDYKVHQGYGASPYIYQSLAIVAADNKSGKGAICGLNRETGEVVWRVDRPKDPNYPSPVVVHAAGQDQLIMTGCNLVSSYDPMTGKKLWEIEGATTECVTTNVTDGSRVFSSGGYPRNHFAAIEADGSGKIAWENGVRVYVPSFLLQEGFIYAVTDAGVAYCWNSATGAEQWKARLGGTFSASLVMVNDVIYASNEKGETSVFKASPKSFQLLGKNKLGSQVMASLAVSNGQIFMRAVDDSTEGRQEMLYCIGD